MRVLRVRRVDTAATMMLEAGVPIKTVSEMGKFFDSDHRRHHGHVTPAGRKQAARTLGKALFGAEK